MFLTRLWPGSLCGAVRPVSSGQWEAPVSRKFSRNLYGPTVWFMWPWHHFFSYDKLTLRKPSHSPICNIEYISYEAFSSHVVLFIIFIILYNNRCTTITNAHHILITWWWGINGSDFTSTCSHYFCPDTCSVHLNINHYKLFNIISLYM